MNQPSHNQIYSQAGSQRGLSLIELMISITIGLLILASLTTLFVNQSRALAELDKSNRMIDNGRYALELMSSNLRLAGFYDNFTPAGPPAATVDPCGTTPITDGILALHIQGYNASTVTSQVASPPCSLTYTAGSDHSLKTGSDILVVRRASTATAASAAGGKAYLQASTCQHDATPFVVSTAPADFILQKNSCTAVGATAAPCPACAALRLFMELTYFVSPDNKVGDGIPTLKQIDQYGMVTPLVEGIEYMQVDYGVDGDSNGDGLMDDINGDTVVNAKDLDGAVDSFTSTCASCTTTTHWAQYWSNVVSTRINIVARNQQKTSGWSDSKTYSLGLAGNYVPAGAALEFKRHTYTQLVRLVNPAGRRETP